MNKTPETPPTMVEGPPIQPAAALLEWLKANAASATGGRRLFRLPVVVSYRDQHRLGIGAAFVGAGEADRAGALFLKLDDGALGISLLDRVRRVCPGPASCVVWLDGHWGSLLERDPPGDGERWRFSVTRFHGVVDATALPTPVRALIEAP